VVIGGGGVAMDVAMTARRLGAKSVQIACLESRAEMPAHIWEIAWAEEEGIGIHVSWGPKQILGKDGRVTGIELKRCTSVFDADKRFNPTYDESVTTTLECDTVILAIGQACDFSLLDSAVETARGLIRVDPASLMTNVAGVFAGGEAVSGPASVIQSIATGRRAAMTIDRYLGGDGVIDEALIETVPPSQRFGRDEGFAGWPRVAMPCAPAESRVSDFGLIELGFDEALARREAGRCLQCDMRLQFASPVLPPEKWLPFDAQHVGAVPPVEGVYQLLDSGKQIIYIAGSANVRQGLEQQLASNSKARYFVYEENRMYTQRESELIQHFLQQHGRLPEGNEVGEDLF